MKKNSDIIFTYPINIFKKKSKVQQNYILHELNCVHIFFCEGLVLLKKVKDKLEISYFNKKNKLFSFIDSSVYLGFFKKKNVYAHNITNKNIAKIKCNQIDFFNKILKKEKLFESFFSDLRFTFANLRLKDSSIAGLGKSLIHWKLENKFCPKCGSNFINDKIFIWENKCNFCNKIYFPRIDPVIIVIVVNENQTLLGRSHHFPDRLYSCLAGFVEPGETLEMAAAREIKEEVGLKISKIRFVTNQPWPFPSSLMFGLKAITKYKKLNIDKNEIEDALWISKKYLREVFKGKKDNISVARKGTIARYLLEKWADDKI